MCGFVDWRLRDELLSHLKWLIGLCVFYNFEYSSIDFHFHWKSVKFFFFIKIKSVNIIIEANTLLNEIFVLFPRFSWMKNIFWIHLTIESFVFNVSDGMRNKKNFFQSENRNWQKIWFWAFFSIKEGLISSKTIEFAAYLIQIDLWISNKF